MNEFHFIKHEHLVLRNKHKMCRFCLLPKPEMCIVSIKELQRSKLPEIYEAVTQRKVLQICLFYVHTK